MQQTSEQELRLAAVLLILYPQDEQPQLVFTRRTELVADHKGQICFPGGVLDADDPSPVHAALRETQEELGVEPSRLRVLASLPSVNTVVTSYLIAPFVAFTPVRPPFAPALSEVAEVIEVPVAALLDPAALTIKQEDSYGVPREMYFFQYGEHVIWGATARILKQFLDGCYSPAWWQTVLAEHSPRAIP